MGWKVRHLIRRIRAYFGIFINIHQIEYSGKYETYDGKVSQARVRCRGGFGGVLSE